jgi:hypothetical protein
MVGDARGGAGRKWTDLTLTYFAGCGVPTFIGESQSVSVRLPTTKVVPFPFSTGNL